MLDAKAGDGMEAESRSMVVEGQRRRKREVRLP